MWVDRSGKADRAGPRPAAELPPAPDPAPEPPPPPDEEEAPDEPAAAEFPVPVRGRVLFVDSDRAPETFTARLWPLDREGESVEIPGREGRFEGTLPAGRYAVRIETDGEEIESDQEVVVDGRGEVEVRLPEAHEVTVVVVDARDRKPLADVLVYEARDWDEPGDRVPGPETLTQEPRRTDATGRLPLGKGRGSTRLYFFAGEYAWHAAAVPFGAGGDVVVELSPGGDARLLIPRFAELGAPQIWARRLFTEEWSRLPPPSDAEEILVGGLAADDFEFRVCRGAWFEDARVYGTAFGTIRAGVTTTITITVTPEPAPVMVKVTGTVRVPPGWNEPPGWITFEGAEESNAEVDERIMFGRHPDRGEGFGERTDEDPSLFRFETRAVPAGRYLVDVRPCQCARYVTVTDRSTHFDIDLPQPVTVRVRVVDARGRDLGPAARVTWYVPMEDRSSWSHDDTVRDGAAFVFQAPPGNVTIDAQAPGFLDAGETFEVTHDRDVTITLGPAGTVVVRLRIDGRPFDGAGARVELDGPDSWSRRGFEAGAATFDHVPPGTSRVALGEVAGCEPVEPVDVEVAAGETREVWFDLRRKVR
jgi:hypothetical protein